MKKNNYPLLLSKIYIALIVFIWVLPNYGSIDVIGAQWFHLGILNLIGLLLVWKTWSKEYLQNIFSNKVVLLFFAFFLWGISSYFYAENQVEVLIESSRIFSLFILLITLFYLIRRFSISFNYLAFLFSVSLIIEIIFVLSLTYLDQGTLFGIQRQKMSLGIASNINITAYSILYKIPFIFYFFPKVKATLLKLIIVFSIAAAFFTVFSLGTRSGILTSFIIMVLVVIFSTLTKDKINGLKQALIAIIIPLLFVFGISELSSKKTNSTSITNRLATVSIANVQEDQSIDERLSNYSKSLNNFKSHPLFGMGLGNWKINSIPFSMGKKSSYVVPYHVHNDFIQYLAELGLVGFALYFTFFLVVFSFLLRFFRKKNIPFEQFTALFLFACVYFMDANFNFPYARVIIQVNLFIVIAFILSKGSLNDASIEFTKGKTLFYLLILTTPILIYSQHRVLKSYIEQKKLMTDFNTSNVSGDIDEILSYESTYPNISISTLPLKSLKAGYLLEGSTEDLQKAVKIAKKGIQDNPYISYSQVLLTRIYAKLGMLDSAKYYAKQAYYNIPTVELHVAAYLPFVKIEKDTLELRKMKKALLNSNSKYIWNQYVNTVLSLKDSLNSVDKELLQVASSLFPDYAYIKNINLMKEFSKAELIKAQKISNKAERLFKQKNYSQAAILYGDAYKIIPNESAYLENQARSYMYDKKYEKAIGLFKALVENHNDFSGLPEYYMSAMYYTLGNQAQCCRVLAVSIKKGYNPAKSLYEKTCIN
ncbi:O-antigen ligase family protein [Flavobacteriaceae bacterium]|nr:O-antigen ligase family protein [Flavobacteriaceae bacterium]